MALQPGTRLGPYEILAAAGAGGMGEVYRARDTRLEREVAIKVLPAHLSANADLRARFEREARAISSLQHPHICVLHDIGRDDATAIDYLVLEYLEGETLAERLKKGPLSLEQTLRIGAEIADALDKAHRKGIVHRDLKPGNVMLTKSGAKLMDFGLAKPSAFGAAASGSVPAFTAAVTQSSPAASPITLAGTVVGTFQYMSPEQVEGRETDGRSDIFAFGAMLYEMVTGRRAFEGKSQLSVASAILEKDPEPITIAQPLSPPALEQLIRTCLAKDPDERLQTAHDAKLHLQWLLQGGATVAAAPAIAAPPSPRWRRWLMPALVALLAVMLVAAVVAWRRAAAIEPPVLKVAIPPPPNSPFRTLLGGGFALSQDGKQMAFIADGPTRERMIWVRRLDTTTAQPLAGTERALHPFWSPDGRFIGFFTDGKLMKIDVAGGPPQALCDVLSPRGGTWGADDTIVFAPDIATPLMRVPASGGTPVKFADLLDNNTSNRWPAFMPDGQTVLFVGTRIGEDKTSVYAARLDGTPPKRLMANSSFNVMYASGHLLYMRDGTLLAQRLNAKSLELEGSPAPLAENVQRSAGWRIGGFSVSATGILLYGTGSAGQDTLQWFDLNGRPLAQLGAPGFYLNPRISPDGKRVAMDMRDGGGRDVWIHDTERNTRTRFTFGGALFSDPVWSPDGKSLAYTRAHLGRYSLVRKAADGTGDEEVLVPESPEAMFSRTWSRDGRYLLYLRPGATTARDVGVYDFVEKRASYPLMTRFAELPGEVSPDGRWLAYASDESGRLQVYLTSFPEMKGKWQVTADGGDNPRWAPNGRGLFFLTLDSKVGHVEANLAGVAPAFGQPRELFDVAFPSLGMVYDVAHDGKRLLIQVEQRHNTDPLMLVVNWPASLKQ
jgi:Tol biopolymer transport system component/tRNA A-37 threonylcarbamoyl transferase component Bud32